MICRLGLYRYLTIAVLFCAAFLCGFQSQACSLREGYTSPTTSQLVDEADLIVLAEVVGQKEYDPEYGMGEVIVHPTTLIKGNELPDQLAFSGMLANNIVDNGGRKFRLGPATPSAPLNLLIPHPEGGSGSCNRYTYNKGMTLLLFVTREGQDFRVIQAPFSRSLEDVPSKNAPWVRAVENYVSLSNLPTPARDDAYVTKAAELRRLGTPTSLALADELDWDRCQRAGGLPIDKCPALTKKYYAQDEAAVTQYEADLEKFEDVTDTAIAEPKAETSSSVFLILFVVSGALIAGMMLHFYRKRS